MRRLAIVFLMLAACSDDKKGSAPEASQCKVDSDCAGAFVELRECELATCSPDGVCVIGAAPDGTECRDGLVCTNPDYCLEGGCTGSPARCVDNDPCTKDSCDFKSGCTFLPASDLPCNDQNACTADDTCNAGQCEPGNAVEGCCRFDGDCADADPCTDDRCTDNACSHTPNFAPCDDLDACTGPDHCDGAGGCTGQRQVCEDGNLCTVDTCNSATGLCTSEYGPDGAACEDGNPCTVDDACDEGLCTGGSSLCECTTDAECATFEDDDICNGTLRCVSLRCVVDPLTVIACNPTGDSACVRNTCDPDTGQCRPAPASNGAFCDDQNPCTSADQCQGGLCLGAVVSCDDGNACTFDACSPVAGCSYSNNNLPCSDGNACTGNDQCTGGSCTGTLLSCDDQNPCTDDTCDPQAGCVHGPSTAPCDDDDACTAGDFCAGGQCRAGASTCQCQVDADCADDDDGNKCNGTLVCRGNACEVDPTTVVSCDTSRDSTCRTTQCTPATGLCAAVDTPAGTSCNDASACTNSDVCAAGVCVGTAVSCNDQNPCTDDSCLPATGCVSAPNTATCNDNNACTNNDRCAAGQCQGTAASCDDGLACTSDSCTPLGGCSNTNLPAGTPCPDTNLCNGDETCQGAACVSGAAPACNDNNACTTDSCDPTIGCRYLPVAQNTPCADADLCDGNEACIDGVCRSSVALDCNDNNACTTDGCVPASGCTHVAGSCNAPNVTCGAAIATTPLATVTISGSGSDPDGGAVSYRWTVTSAPNGSTSQPNAPTAATTTFYVDLAGDYELTLTVTDNEGESSSCKVFISAVPTELLHIELVWDTPYGDADLHMVRPGVAVATAWYTTDDCWYGNTTTAWPPNGQANNASLDVDETDGYGPENINIDQTPANGLFTIGVAYYCSHSVAARGGGPPEPVTPGDGPAIASVRIYCRGTLAQEIPGVSLDRTGRFVTVGTVEWSNCNVVTSKSAGWVPMPVAPGQINPYHCAIPCTNNSPCPAAETCSAGYCRL